MSEVESKQTEEYVIGGKPQPSRLKKLTSASSWTSPFRNAGTKKNVYQEFKDQNSVSQVKVPKKFASHPTLEAEQREKEQREKAEAAKLKKEKKEAEEKKKKEAEEKSKAEAEKEAEGEADVGVAKDNEEAEGAEDVVSPAEAAREDTSVVSEAKIEPLSPESVKAAAEPAKDAEKEEPADDTTAADEKAKEVEEAQESAEAQHSKVKELYDEDLAKNTLEGDDNIVDEIKENPVEVGVPNGAKYESVELPNQEVLDRLKDKPVLLNKYQQLNADAIGSVAKSLDDPNKIIDLGSGLRLTQAQLLEIASKRVAPVIATINEEVTKSKQEDDINRKKEYDAKVAKHQGKLDKDFSKYQEKVAKLKAGFDADIDSKLANLAAQIEAAHQEAERFEKQTKEEIETAKTEYEEREKNAVDQHEIDKETLIKNREELTETKKQELEDSKKNQETTANEIEELKKRKAALEEANTELSKKLEELTEKLSERQAVVDDLKEKHTGQLGIISKHEETKGGLQKKIDDSNKELDEKRARHATLAGEVGVLGGILAAHVLKLTDLKADKKDRTKRLADAKREATKWQQERREMAERTHREHEQKRLEAKEAAETERFQQQLEEERKRLEEEKKKAEEERLRQQEEQRLIDEENERLEAEKKRVEEERSAATAAAVAASAAGGSSAGQATAAGKEATVSRHAEPTENATPKHDLGVNAAIVPQNKDIKTSGEPLPDQSKEAKPKGEDKKKGHGGLLAGGALGAAGGAAAGGALAGSSSGSNGGKSFGVSAPNVGGSAPDTGVSKESRPEAKRSGSTKKRLRTLFGGKKDADENTASESTSKALTGGTSGGAAAGAAAAHQDSKGPLSQGKDSHDVSSNASTEVFSVYEEVSDEEFERNRNNPRYIEVDEDEAQKLLRKNQDLLQ